MAAYAWAKSRSLLAKFWPASVKPLFNEQIVVDKPKNDFGSNGSSNERYLSALKDGGIWLS